MNLDKAYRAMHYCEAWTNFVQAACLFAGKEYGPDVLQAMTKRFLDDLEYDPGTMQVSVPTTVGNPLMSAVEAWEPPTLVDASVEVEPEFMDDPGIVEHLLDRVDALEAQVALYQQTNSVTES